MAEAFINYFPYGCCPVCGRPLVLAESQVRDREHRAPYDRYVCEAESSVPGHPPVELQVENRREVL